jgi:hypothetical protein
MIRQIVALTVGLLVVVALGGWGRQDQLVRPEEPQTAQAILAVTTDEPGAIAQIPADFPTVMGYRPSVVQIAGLLLPTRSNGSCSSPFGGTPYHFSAACRQHDLGYDLLRYANRKGEPLGPWARRAIDARFADQTMGRCHHLGCRMVAGFYTGGVWFNSWRQGYGTPVFEPMRRFLVPIGAGLAVAFLIAFARLPRRIHLAVIPPLRQLISRPVAIRLLANVGLVATAMFIGHGNRLRVDAANQLSGWSRPTEAMTALAAVLIAVVLVQTVSAAQALFGWVIRQPRRAVTVAVVPMLVLTGCSSTVPAAAPAAAESTSSCSGLDC